MLPGFPDKENFVTIGRYFFRCVSRLATVSFLLLSVALDGQGLPAGQPIQPMPTDPVIAGALRQVSASSVKATIEKLVSFNNRSTLSSMETSLAPNTGVAAAANWIESQFKDISASCGGCLEVKRDDFTEPPQSGPRARIVRPTRITNIYAVMRGTDPAQAGRMVLVTGHYDSRNSDNFNTHDPAPGANDDASGVAVSIECARVLSKLKFPATIVFAAVAGEEQGLVGSAHLAKLAKPEGWRLEAVLNNDIVGGDTTPGETIQDKTVVRVFSEGMPSDATPQQIDMIRSEGAESDSPSRELARLVADVGATYFAPTTERPTSTPGRPRSQHLRLVPAFHPVLIFRRDRYLRGGDHISFNREGFSAVRFTEWRENYNHQHQNVRVENGIQYGDLLQYVDFNYVADVARLNIATLATLAAAPGPPQNVRRPITELDNNTQLAWEPPAGMPAGATYEVVSRTTTDPAWTTVQSAGTTKSITLPISNDNVIFAVRTVDRAGHASVAVLPTPVFLPPTRPALKPQPATRN